MILAQHVLTGMSSLGMILWIAIPTAGQDQLGSDHANLEMDEVIVAAFQQTCQGWSSDEVLLNDELNKSFLAACRDRLPEAKSVDLNWRLLTLRKQSKLPSHVTKRRRDNHNTYMAVAEIVARQMEDKYGLNTDRIMCDPACRAEFDAAAHTLAPQVDAYLIRKAAFGLRKARQLQPELVTRVAEWNRDVTAKPLSEIEANLEAIPTAPGIYIFRSPDGYLYVGESHNLQSRLSQHLDASNEAALIRLFEKNDLSLEAIQIEMHVFDPQSRAKDVRYRRAYESQLIESRHPRFNIRP